MFKLMRSVSNNMSEAKYIKAQGGLVVKPNDVSQESTNKPVSKLNEDLILKELDRLEVDMRHNNLRIFLKNIIPCRLKQFFLYTVPALIVAGGITLFVLPSTHVKTENLEAFKKEDVIFVDGMQYTEKDDKTYYGVYFARNYVDKNNGNTEPFEGTKMEFYVTENLEGFKINAKIDSNGALSISSATKGEYVDLKEYDSYQLTEMEPKYVELFDKVVDMVVDSTYFNNKDDERLKAISDSDKSRIVGSLVSYYSIGDQDVQTVKSNWWLRIVTLVALGLYDWLIIYLKKEQYVFESRKVTNRDGELQETRDTFDLAFANLALKYKEAFMDAEERRIKRIHELLVNNFEEGTVDKVLTKHELKLILK